MILLDTNVVLEPLKPRPDPAVVRWLNAQRPDQLYLPSIVVAELCYGLAVLPSGRRKDGKRAAVEQAVARFADRILAFDLAAAAEYGAVMAAARAAGTPLPVLDGQIAAIARVHGGHLATRNVKHFEPAGIPLVDPWHEPS